MRIILFKVFLALLLKGRCILLPSPTTTSRHEIGGLFDLLEMADCGFRDAPDLFIFVADSIDDLVPAPPVEVEKILLSEEGRVGGFVEIEVVKCGEIYLPKRLCTSHIRWWYVCPYQFAEYRGFEEFVDRHVNLTMRVKEHYRCRN
jgi:hypothetical protein